MKTITLMLLLGLSVGCCLLALASCGGTGPATASTTDAATDLPACEHEWDAGRVTTANGKTEIVTATEEGGLLVFTVPAGNAVTLTKR